MVKLEYVAEVDKEIGVVGAVGVADASVDGTEEGVVAVACLDAEEDRFGEELVEVVGGGGDGTTQEDIVVVEYAVLRLKLYGKQLVANILHVAYSGEGHLLFNGVAEPFAAEGVAEGQRDVVADQES